MKKLVGNLSPVAAVLSSFATLACCFPIGFAAALGAGTASAFFNTLRPFLLGLSVAFIGLGFWQQHRAKQCSMRGRWLGGIFLWAAAVIVLGMIFFPQQIGSLLADLSMRSAQ